MFFTMVSGFPSDFPCPPKEENVKEFKAELNFESGVFVRSELSEVDVVPISPVQKRSKITLEAENDETGQNNRVKFCIEPPKEFAMFPDSEYDRTSIGKRNKYTVNQ